MRVWFGSQTPHTRVFGSSSTFICESRYRVSCKNLRPVHPESDSIYSNKDWQLPESYDTIDRWVGGVSPLLFIAAFSLAPNPGRYRVICMPCFGLHPQGFAVSSVMSVSAQQECIITQDIPYRFWSIAVILTTPEKQGCVPDWWGDFPQLRILVTVGRTLPLIT